ncbi:hypothetical protein LINGRAHAP2_LOCUS25613, partial [Linum grandiflorum]
FDVPYVKKTKKPILKALYSSQHLTTSNLQTWKSKYEMREIGKLGIRRSREIKSLILD